MPRAFLDIHPDIRQARTLPSALYHDPVWFDHLRDRVFARGWHLVGDAAAVAAPGDVWPFTLLEGCLGEPLVLTRDEGGAAHCLSNVCTHRGNLVVEGAGRCQTLRCRYHGRRFGLDGAFLSMPEFDGAVGFPTAADSLPRVAVGSWGPLVFASLDPLAGFDDFIGPARERLGWLPLETFRFDPATSVDYDVGANWALYCDNYLEGFHIPFVHAALTAALDFPSYRTELFEWSSLQVGVAAEGEPAFAPPAGHPDHGQAVAAYYFYLFPATMLNFYPWGLSVNIVEPRGPARTRVAFRSYVWRPELRGAGAGADLHRVEMEDEAVVEATQRGVRSRLYDRGRYSPTMERGVHHFHRLLARCVDDGDKGATDGSDDDASDGSGTSRP